LPPRLVALTLAFDFQLSTVDCFPPIDYHLRKGIELDRARFSEMMDANLIAVATSRPRAHSGA